ncbi:MAG: nuclear transport factor 2 family protein [Alphaproteobacteria bacterium]|nr:nuclear transport factor 2 family protein [Alphaproteobacteria bacterium]
MTQIPLEDRVALEDLLTSYCLAVDTLSDMDALLGVFTPDAVCDLSGIGLPSLHGHEGIRGFFDSVFADMTHHAHFVSNFRVDRYEGDTASIRAYVMGMGRSRDGNDVLVYVRYFLDCVRTPDGWKVTRFFEDALMPLPGSLDEIHGKR